MCSVFGGNRRRHTQFKKKVIDLLVSEFRIALNNVVFGDPFEVEIQKLHCGHCDKDTKQKVYENGHERDSSQDRYECLECGYVKYGLTGEWEYVKKE